MGNCCCKFLQKILRDKRDVRKTPRVSEIDSVRMRIHVHRGKGAKDCLIPLLERLLSMLRNYWKTHRHQRLIFPARGLYEGTLLRLLGPGVSRPPGGGPDPYPQAHGFTLATPKAEPEPRPVLCCRQCGRELKLFSK